MFKLLPRIPLICLVGCFVSSSHAADTVAELKPGDAQLESPMVLVDEEQPHVWVPEGKGDLLDLKVVERGAARFDLELPGPGVYQVEAMIQAADGTSDSFFVKFSGDDQPLEWRTGPKPALTWVKVPKEWKIERPETTLSFLQREDGTRLGGVRVIKVFPPKYEDRSEAPHVEPPFDMPELTAPEFPDAVFNIVEYGAKPEDKAANITAFRKAVQACHDAGGGRVLVPVGKWLTGPIHLKSNVELHVAEGATILFSDDFDDYLPPVFVRYEGIECYNYSPLIYAYEQENVAVTGRGILDGNGQAWWDYMRQRRAWPHHVKVLYDWVLKEVPVEKRVTATSERHLFLRPSFIEFNSCRNVLIEDINMVSGPMWNIHPAYCENVIIRGVSVVNRGPHNDGVTPDSCKNVLIENVYLATADDTFCLKAGLNEDAWRVGKSTENVIIRNCYTKRCKASGGITIGSEMSGGVRNVFAHDCQFDDLMIGVWIKSKRGRGGVVENIWVQDIEIGSIGRNAIWLSMFYPWSTLQPAGDRPGVFRNIFWKDIHVGQTNRSIDVVGLEELPMENVVLENITIEQARTGARIVDTKNITLKNIVIGSNDPVFLEAERVQNLTIEESGPAEQAETFLHAKGASTKDIVLRSIDFSKVRNQALLEEEVSENSVRIED
jgi:hypothetical protein